MGAPKQTIGFRYYFSLHMGLGRGPVNEIAEIRVKDVPALDAPIECANSGRLVHLNKPELFGGDKKEGGIDGLMYVYNGAKDQTLQPALSLGGKSLPSIAASLGGDVPNFRGVTTIWYDGLVCSMNPYPKEWSFRVRRHNAGWYDNAPWYPVMARVLLVGTAGEIHAMNGAHILYEVNTNPEWGRGMPPELIDANSYREAANTLCREGVGLCIPWFRQENLKDFIPIVINHISAAQYVDRETGLMTIRLIRGDYDVNDLPLFTPDTGLLDILDEDNSGEDTAYNEIVATGFDPTTKEEIQVRVQNLGSIQSLGEIISNKTDYKGFATRELLARAAQRDLKVQLPLRKMTVVLDRRGWRIAPGMPFRISDPSRGIENLVLRAGECVDGPLTSGSINIKAVEDVFAMPDTAYVVPQEPVWSRPDFTPVPSPEKRLYEMNWRDIYRLTTQPDRDAVVEGNSYVAVMARKPEDILSDGYDVYTRPEGGVYDNAAPITVGWTGWLKLETSIQPLDTTLTFAEDGLLAFTTEFTEGMVVLIDDEQIQFTAFDEVSRVATIKRGVADTIPTAHLANASIWLVDDELGTDGLEYQDGETVYALALTRTSTAIEDSADSEELSIVVDQRVFRPYPPGNVKMGGESVYNLSPGVDPVLTWAHRDRVLQGDTVIGHGEGSVGPEPGVTYNIRIYGVEGDPMPLLREVNVGAVDAWTYDPVVDGSPNQVWMELESVRNGIVSEFYYRFKVVLNGGWGSGWGDGWGDTPEVSGTALDPDTLFVPVGPLTIMHFTRDLGPEGPITITGFDAEPWPAQSVSASANQVSLSFPDPWIGMNTEIEGPFATGKGFAIRTAEPIVPGRLIKFTVPRLETPNDTGNLPTVLALVVKFGPADIDTSPMQPSYNYGYFPGENFPPNPPPPETDEWIFSDASGTNTEVGYSPPIVAFSFGENTEATITLPDRPGEYMWLYLSVASVDSPGVAITVTMEDVTP